MSERNQVNTDSGATANNSDNRESQQQGSRNTDENRDRRNHGANQHQHMGLNERNWQGAKTEIGVVLGLKTERLTYKRTFEVFKDKLATYVLSEFTNAKDVLPTIKKMVDPRNDFKSKYASTELSDEDKKKSVEQAMQDHRIKLYVAREMKLRDNMDNLYGIVTGQCSHSLISILENDTDFNGKDEKCDVLWLT